MKKVADYLNVNINQLISQKGKKMDPITRKNWELKAEREDDDITREIVILLAEKELSIDRAYRVLEDARSMLPRLAKLPIAKSLRNFQ